MAAPAPELRQAVVLVHGIGEQVPMETVRDFAQAVWSAHEDLHDPASPDAGELFFVPDPDAGSRELLRLSTRRSRPRRDGKAEGVRTDFFELYWADATRDSTWHDFALWYRRLILRRLRHVPAPVLPIFVLLWLINVGLVLTVVTAAVWLIPTAIGAVDTAAAAGALAAAAIVAAVALFFATRDAAPLLPRWAWFWIGGVASALAAACAVALVAVMLHAWWEDAADDMPLLWLWLVPLAAGLLSLQAFLIQYFGDVARYTLPLPGNIGARQQVRDRGLELLDRLTKGQRYDRVVLVGHSLGTVVAYDLVMLLWADYVSSLNKAERDVPSMAENSALARAVTAVTDAASAEPFDVARFRQAQRHLFRTLQKAAQPPTASAPILESPRWLISDLVTIGCPLTHADFLLARTASDLSDRFGRRELSTCPPRPARAPGGQAPHLTYAEPEAQEQRFLHDAAFSTVRWSNIHDAPKNRFLFLLGDFISGRVRHLFGPGILDVTVRPSWAPGPLPPRFFTHTSYWRLRQESSGAAPASVQVIRHAVNLLDEAAPEAALVAARDA